MSDRVRVTRLIEIEYPDQEAYEKDRNRWSLPANGTRQFGRDSGLYKTATFLSESIGQPQLQVSDGPTADYLAPPVMEPHDGKTRVM